ncbi:MAG: hypothetical protein HY329_01125 [Chloroflexi bacterium]|nr:hypothetical protein [Chloroflexota bacterium]
MQESLRREQARPFAWSQLVGRGALAGIAGGLVFGAMMALMGMMPMIAGLVGSQNPAVGFVVHLVISAIIGAIYGATVGIQSGAQSYRTGWLFGLVYGAIWWVLGPLLIMPSLMGMGPQFGAAFTQMNLMSLMGHALFGVVAGLAYAKLSRDC